MIARMAASPVPGPMSSMCWSRLGGLKSPVLIQMGTTIACFSGSSAWKNAEQIPVRRRLYGVKKSTIATVTCTCEEQWQSVDSLLTGKHTARAVK